MLRLLPGHALDFDNVHTRITGLKLGNRIPYLLGIVVAASVAFSITVQLGTSDRCRQGQLALNRIQDRVEMARTALTGALSRRYLEVETESDVTSAFRYCSRNADTLRAFFPDTRFPGEIRDTITAADSAASDVVDAVARDRCDVALAINQDRLNPLFRRLGTETSAASAELNLQAEKAQRAAQVGSTAALVFASLMIVMLARRSSQERARRMVAVHEAEKRSLQQSEQQLSSMIRNASDIITIIDAEGMRRYVSPVVERVLGHSAETLTGKLSFELVHPDDRAEVQRVLDQVRGQGASMHTECRLRHAGGEWRHFAVVLTDLPDEPGIQGVLATFRDVTDRVEFEQKLSYQAFHDTLTGLPNRALFMDRLEHSLARSARAGGGVAVVFVDIDNFKVVNDSLGHEAGDKLLVMVADRLRACARSSDTVARLGGDEFTLILDDIPDAREACGIAGRVQEVLRRPFAVDDRELFVTASLGVAVGLNGSFDPKELLRDADTAMYCAKTSGKATLALFNTGMNERAVERLEFESGLRQALEEGQFVLYYQPIVDIVTGNILEVEALIRWQHPALGLIQPGRFISIAEETGLIVPIGCWVLEQACREARRWHEQQPDFKVTVGVNLSCKQLQQSDLVETVSEIVRLTGMDPAFLKLEITESAMMLDMDATVEKLKALRVLGIRIAVDDFGTGYSSMSYLSSLPIDTLKIDRSFVQQVTTAVEGEAIVRAIISLAKTLELKVTCEGIETIEQQSRLQGLGCDLGQGFHYSLPLASDALSVLLAGRKSLSRKTLGFNSGSEENPTLAA